MLNWPLPLDETLWMCYAVSINQIQAMTTPTKNYRVRVETYDGCVTIWYEKSKAKSASKLILNRVYNQLCGLNVKEVEVTPSV